MEKKRWEIIKEKSGGFLLARGNTIIHFDSIVDNGIYWQLYRNEYLVAELGVRENEVVNFDDYAEKM